MGSALLDLELAVLDLHLQDLVTQINMVDSLHTLGLLGAEEGFDRQPGRADAGQAALGQGRRQQLRAPAAQLDDGFFQPLAKGRQLIDG